MFKFYRIPYSEMLIQNTPSPSEMDVTGVTGIEMLRELVYGD